ncbi:MAG: DUF202 domain-containing protein [Microbacterium sp.]
MSAPFDPGLQPERTLLAWRRTCLSFAVASILVARYTIEEFGMIGLFLGIASAGLAVAAYLSAAVGYRRVHAALHAHGHTGEDGRPFLLATLAVLALGAAAAAYLVIEVVRL